MLNLGAVEDIWSVLVEDDWLPVQVTSTGHRQEGQEAEHVEVAPEWCGAPAVLDQDWLVRLAATACQRSALPQRLPGRLPACLLAWAAGAEIVSYLPALASTLSFSLAHYCPRLGAIKNRVTYQKMKKKIFWCLILYWDLIKSNTFWRWCHHGLGKVRAEGMAKFLK